MLRHEGKKRGIRSISILLLTLVLMCAVSGCGKKNEKKEDTTEKVTTTTESQSESGETGESNFDFSQVFDNIEVNGKHVPFPFSLNDLGDEYEYTSIVDMGDGTFGATLKYNNNIIAYVYYKVDNKEDITRDSKVYRIDLSPNGYQAVKINKIGCNDSAADVRKNIVGLDEKFNDNGEITIMQKENNNNKILIFFDTNETIISIYIIKEENK